MQKTDFPFEVLIHDDCSTDGTAEIIKEYEEKYPDIIKPVYEKENQYSKGVSISRTYNFPRVKGEYFAMCEGDDYWIDPYKLQKQVDFLDSNPEYSICFHLVNKIYETKIKADEIFPTENHGPFVFENLLNRNFIPTNSVMYRTNMVENFAKEFPSKIFPGDWYLHLMFAKVGKIGFLDEIMSVYRVNSKGIWYNAYINQERLYLENCFKMMNFHKNIYTNITESSTDYYEKVYNFYNRMISLLKKNHLYIKLFWFKIRYFNETGRYYKKIIKENNRKLVKLIRYIRYLCGL